MLLAARGTGSNARFDVEQTTDFYPFGLAHGSLNNLHLNRYLYGGKEYQNASVGGAPLGLYDFYARYYNPVLGRWFNIDPQLQTTNPYLYCGNSPMMYVDPDGEFFFKAIGSLLGPIGTIIGAVLDIACQGAMMSAATYTANVAMSKGGFDNWSNKGFWNSVGSGAISAVATAGVGVAFGNTGSFLNEVGRGLTHGAVQGGLGAARGDKFWSGFASGALGSYAGHGAEALGLTKSTFGILTYSSLAGGIGSWATGGNFLQGAANGLMVATFNQLQHKVEAGQERNRIRKTVDKYREFIDSGGTATDIANFFTRDEIAILRRSGVVFKWVGRGVYASDFYLTVDAINNGQPWAEHAYNTIIGFIGTEGALPGAGVATTIDSYKEGIKFTGKQINEFNRVAPKKFLNDILFWRSWY